MLETLSRIILLQLAEIFSARQRAFLRKEVLGFMSTQLGLSPKRTRLHHLSSDALLTASPPNILTLLKRPVRVTPQNYPYSLKSSISTVWTRRAKDAAEAQPCSPTH